MSIKAQQLGYTGKKIVKKKISELEDKPEFKYSARKKHKEKKIRRKPKTIRME